MRLQGVGPRTLIRREVLAANDPGLADGEALIIDTGWGSRWDQPSYVRDAPAFAGSTLEWFKAQPFSMLVLDTPVMECLWCAEEGLGNEQGDLLAPLYKLGMSSSRLSSTSSRIERATGTLISLPLAVEGVCSAPSRVLYVEDVDWADQIAQTTALQKKGV